MWRKRLAALWVTILVGASLWPAIAAQPASATTEQSAVAVEKVAQTQPLEFQNAPILGWAGPDFFTVSCSVNMDAEVTLTVGKETRKSPSGRWHMLKMDKLAAGNTYQYSLTAEAAGIKAETTGNGWTRCSQIPRRSLSSW